MNSNFILTLAALAGLATINHPLSTARAQGSLTPPPGPPAPVMKTLDQIEPRLPIGPDTTPGNAEALYSISQPGSYYLTDNVQGVSNKHGIQVNASGVTIDLNGFEIVGVPSAQAVSGIVVPTSERFTARDGTVRNWAGHGIVGANANFLVERVNVSANGSHGIQVIEGTVHDCLAQDNGGTGVGARIVTRVIVRNNKYGISAQRITDSLAEGNLLDGFYGALIVTGSIATQNKRDGFSECRLVQSCETTDNGRDGIRIAYGGQAVDCDSRNNTRHGILLTGNARAQRNHCADNGQGPSGDGIHAENDRNTIVENSCNGNRRGITVTASMNRIEGNNLVHNNTIGLFVAGQYNLIIRNTARNPNAGAVNWTIAAGNRGGIYVGPAQNAAINGFTGGPGSGTTDPFANLSF